MENKEQEAKELLKSGQYQKAADIFSELLEERVAKFGESSEECAGMYFLYGKSLLYLAQSEIDVLGGIMKKDMKKKLHNELGFPKDASSSDEEEEERPDVVDTMDMLELAWDVLELARVIYSSANKKEELAEVYLVIGDLSMESDNMKQAVTDYSQCLALRESILSPDDRRLAETHYSIALAYEYQNQMKEALNHFNSAHKILSGRLAQSSKEETEEGKAEAKDLAGIVEELTTKIDELTKNDKVSSSTQVAKPASIQSTHIQDVGAVNGYTVLTTKRKAQVLDASPNDLAENGKKIKQ